jgi:hypothetical protein
LGGDHQVGGCGFGSHGFDTRGCFLLGIPSSWLRACCRFGLRLLRPGRFPGGGHFRLLGHLRDRLRRGFCDSGWSGGGLDNTPSSDVIPPLAQVHLLGRGPSPLSFWSSRVACGGALLGTLRCLLCKSRLRFFPLNIAPVVCHVVSPAATALRLFSQGRAPTGEVGAATRDTLGRVSAVTLRVRWQHLHCNGPFGVSYDSTDTRNPQSSVSDCTFDTSGPRTTETMKWGIWSWKVASFYTDSSWSACSAIG